MGDLEEADAKVQGEENKEVDEKSGDKEADKEEADAQKEEETNEVEEEKKEEEEAPVEPVRMEYSKDFKEDWHNEWEHGDFPSWKTTYPKAALKFEDRQSDGIIGNFLQVEPEETAAELNEEVKA